MTNPREHVDASWQALLAAVEGIPDARMAEAGAVGEWSVKDVLTHVAYWDTPAQNGADGAQQAEEEWQPVNERVAAERANWSLAEVRQNLHETHQRMLAALDSQPNIDPEQVRSDWEHYDEHAAEIRAWRVHEGV